MADESTFLKETEALHNLRALEEIEKNPEISQRELSNRLGVALGITNALLKTMVRKGLIKIRGDNNRSLTYHLTHAGVLAKSALAVKWTINTIDYYRQARREVADRLTAIAADGVKTIVLLGLSELTEIAIIVANEIGLEIIGCVDLGESGRDSILSLPIGSEDLITEIQPEAIVVSVEIDPEIAAGIARYSEQGFKTYPLVG